MELSRPILVSEILKSEKFIVEQVQRDAYAQEIHALATDSALPRSSTIRVFNPTLHERVIVVGGRLAEHKGDLPRNPMIL